MFNRYIPNLTTYSGAVFRQDNGMAKAASKLLIGMENEGVIRTGYQLGNYYTTDVFTPVQALQPVQVRQAILPNTVKSGTLDTPPINETNSLRLESVLNYGSDA